VSSNVLCVPSQYFYQAIRIQTVPVFLLRNSRAGNGGYNSIFSLPGFYMQLRGFRYAVFRGVLKPPSASRYILYISYIPTIDFYILRRPAWYRGELCSGPIVRI